LALQAVKLNFADALVFFMECAARVVDFTDLGSPVASAGWLAIIAFLIAARLLINDFFSIDMVAILSFLGVLELHTSAFLIAWAHWI
jgi:hypothetical protein